LSCELGNVELKLKQQCTEVDCKYSRGSRWRTYALHTSHYLDCVHQRIVRKTLRVTRERTRGLKLLSDVRLATSAGETVAMASTAVANLRRHHGYRPFKRVVWQPFGCGRADDSNSSSGAGCDHCDWVGGYCSQQQSDTRRVRGVTF